VSGYDEFSLLRLLAKGPDEPLTEQEVRVYFWLLSLRNKQRAAWARLVAWLRGGR
jgi:hypothetical protein